MPLIAGSMNSPLWYALATAQIQDGESVLDVGCGCGDVTILARATGSGHALGADFWARP
jgi:ribosomal protein L11 methylase PrmA